MYLNTRQHRQGMYPHPAYIRKMGKARDRDLAPVRATVKIASVQGLVSECAVTLSEGMVLLKSYICEARFAP